MNLNDLRRALDVSGPEPIDVLIQLPDNEGPVSFTVDTSFLEDDLVLLFPKPPIPGHVWDHNNNFNNYVPEPTNA